MNNKSSFNFGYKFDPTIPHWRERLASAYEMLFQKIDEMEMNKEIEEEMQKVDSYGEQNAINP